MDSDVSACKVQAEVGVHIRPDGKYVTNYELVGKRPQHLCGVSYSVSPHFQPGIL